jgi:hypothetical protein
MWCIAWWLAWGVLYSMGLRLEMVLLLPLLREIVLDDTDVRIRERRTVVCGCRSQPTGRRRQC